MVSMHTSIQHYFATYLLALALALIVPLGCSDDDASTDADTGAIEDTGGRDASPDSGADAQDAASPQDVVDDAQGDAADVSDANDASDTADADRDADNDAGDTTPDTTPAPSGETCETAIDVSAGGTWADQSTVGASDDYASDLTAPNCPSGSFSGPDRVYVATPTTTTEYKVTVEPAIDFDPFIYVRASCSDQACMAGTVLNGTGVPESVTFELQANETGHIIVDGELGDAGDYTLTVEIL
jgi:hypothetical protein